jgi:hypothetical protein
MITDTLVYLAYIYSVLSYKLTFWGNSVDRNKIFKIQNKINTISAGV